MNTPEDEHDFEAWLEANVRATPLSDEGFTAAVLARLPDPRPAVHRGNRAARLWRAAACVLGAAAGTGVAALGLGLSGSLSGQDPVQLLRQAEMILMNPVTILTVSGALGSLLFIFWQELRVWWFGFSNHYLA